MGTSSPVSAPEREFDADAIKDWVVARAKPLSIGAGAVVVRAGHPGVDTAGRPVIAVPDPLVALARTAAFFSNNQAPLSSRTVRFISGIHFPPGIAFTPNAALYGIENTNRHHARRPTHPCAAFGIIPNCADCSRNVSAMAIVVALQWSVANKVIASGIVDKSVAVVVHTVRGFIAALGIEPVFA